MNLMNDDKLTWEKRESDKVFRTLAETTSAAIFIVQDSTIRYANPAARVITGYEPQELNSMAFWEITHPAYRNVIKQQGVGDHWGNEMPARYELKLLTKEGRERWVDVSAGAMEFEGKPAFVVTAFDITDRDIAEQALRKAKDELEASVAARTRELREANEQLGQANRRLQVELVERERAAEERERLLGQMEKQRHHAEQLKELLQTIYETTPDGMAVMGGPELEFLFVNSAYRSLTLQPEIDPVGRKFKEVWPPENGFDGYGRAAGVLSSGQAMTGYRFECVQPDGSRRYFSSHLRRLIWQEQAAVLMVMWETTAVEEAHRRAEHAAAEVRRRAEELEAQRARLDTIIANTPVAIVVTDEAGGIVLINPVAQKLFGSSASVGKHLESNSKFSFCNSEGESYEAQDLPLTRSARYGETHINFELSLVTPKGNKRYLLVNSAPILYGKGSINGAVAIFQDITTRKEAEEETLRHSTRIEVQQHLIQYRERERLLIAQDLHDGPLQELIGVEYSLEEAKGMARGGPVEETIGAVCTTLRRIISEIRTFSSDLRPPTLIPFGLEKAIRSHAESFQEKHHGLRIQLELAQDKQVLPEKVRLALFRIYQELLNNVVRHAEASLVSVRFNLDAEKVELVVQDNGCGFEVPRRWIELARAGHLGLVGAQERAEAVGGAVRITSSPGEGTTVQIVVPRHTEQKQTKGF